MARSSPSAAADVWPALQEVFAEFRALGAHYLRGHGLSVGQYLTLHRIEKSGGLRLSTLAEELGISRPAVTALVASLEARGWVRRAPTSADRRGVVVRLTRRTHARMAALDRELAALVRGAAARCPARRRAATVATLRAVSEGLRNHGDLRGTSRGGGR